MPTGGPAPTDPGEASDQDRRVGPLRVGGGEDDSERHAFGPPDEGGTRRADRVHHSADVVHPCFESRRSDDAV